MGKIKPKRRVSREFWFKYILTSTVILAKLLSFPELIKVG